MEKELLPFLKSYKLFSSLDDTAIVKIAEKFTAVELKKGETLFKQGSPSDYVYILVKGKLAAQISTPENEIKTVGHVEVGETVGEMGALTKEPRALTVKALRTSLLYKIANKHFIAICRQYPSVMFDSIHPVIARSQNIIQMLTLKKQSSQITLIAANPAISIEPFLFKFIKYAKHYRSINLISDLLPEFKTLSLSALKTKIAELNEGKKTKKNIFILQSFHSRLAKICLKKSKNLYIVADSAGPAMIDEDILNFIHSSKSPLYSNPELILLHGPQVRMPQNTIAWLNLTEFNLYHHVSITRTRHYHRLIRFILGKAVGLVLGGGGTRGWAHMGVLKALLEKKIPIDFIGGTSVGAIIAACYAMDESYKQTLLKSEKIFTAARGSVSFLSLTWPVISIFDAKRFTNALHTIFSDYRIEDLWLPYFCLSSNMSKYVEEVHREGLLWEKTRASASIPGLIPPMVINGELHLDGGILNNLPVDVMKQFIGVRGKIIAVEINTALNDTHKYSFPPILTLKNVILSKLGFSLEKYKFPKFIDTFLRGLLMGSSVKTKMNRVSATLLIDLNLNKFSLLFINKKQGDKMFEIGYEKALQMIEQAKKKE